LICHQTRLSPIVDANNSLTVIMRIKLLFPRDTLEECVRCEDVPQESVFVVCAMGEGEGGGAFKRPFRVRRTNEVAASAKAASPARTTPSVVLADDVRVNGEAPEIDFLGGGDWINILFACEYDMNLVKYSPNSYSSIGAKSYSRVQQREAVHRHLL